MVGRQFIQHFGRPRVVQPVENGQRFRVGQSIHRFHNVRRVTPLRRRRRHPQIPAVSQRLGQGSPQRFH